MLIKEKSAFKVRLRDLPLLAEGDVISYCDFLYRHMTADEMYEAADIVAVVEYTGQSSVVQPDRR